MIVLTSSDGSSVNSLDRFERLTRVYARLHAIEYILVRLHDHKGCLSAWWMEVPTGEQKNLVEDAWIAEGEQNFGDSYAGQETHNVLSYKDAWIANQYRKAIHSLET